MLDDAGGAGRSDAARGDWHACDVQFLPQSGDPSEDGDDSRRGEPRPLDPGVRCGMERAGVSRVRAAIRSSSRPLREALQILKPLMRDGHVDFAGRYYQARNCEIVPRGPRPEGPPLMVGSELGPR